MPKVGAIIQARMSSRRFPGKVLAPFKGRPLIAHVIERVAKAVPRSRVVLATSAEASDDPLAAYARTLGVEVFRGTLDDVVGRFRACLRGRGWEWFFRICADSPTLEPSLLKRMLARARPDGPDIITNVFPRTFPKGQSAELLKTATFLALKPAALSAYEREHVTPVYYSNPGRFRILNLTSGRPGPYPRRDVATVADLRRLERL